MNNQEMIHLLTRAADVIADYRADADGDAPPRPIEDEIAEAIAALRTHSIWPVQSVYEFGHTNGHMDRLQNQCVRVIWYAVEFEPHGSYLHEYSRGYRDGYNGIHEP